MGALFWAAVGTQGFSTSQNCPNDGQFRFARNDNSYFEHLIFDNLAGGNGLLFVSRRGAGGAELV
jgi:hypothetical protein